jgi:hypothetical protein
MCHGVHPWSTSFVSADAERKQRSPTPMSGGVAFRYVAVISQTDWRAASNWCEERPARLVLVSAMPPNPLWSQ